MIIMCKKDLIKCTVLPTNVQEGQWHQRCSWATFRFLHFSIIEINYSVRVAEEAKDSPLVGMSLFPALRSACKWRGRAG